MLSKGAWERLQLAAGVDYVLRFMRLYADVAGGDPVTALVFVSAAQACAQHVRNMHRHTALMGSEFLPDDLRRPVSLSALARSLNMSVETTRRHVSKLCALGLASRTEDGGVMVDTRHLNRPEVRDAVSANTQNLEVFVNQLARLPAARIVR
ncbi:MAG: hypothetical protein ACK4M2_04015 [Brevundimonas sp.]